MKMTQRIQVGRADTLIKWLMFTAAITGLALLSAFYPIHGNVPFIVIPSILVLLLAKPVFFERLKLTTLLSMRIGMWLLLRANSLAIGGWMQIGAKSWFEREFHSDRFERFVLWTKQSKVQLVLMLINLALMGYGLYLTFAHSGIRFEWAPFFLN